MRRIFFEKPYRFILIPLAAIAFLSLISFVVMQLWNNLLPDILHVTTITFWQAAGIFILCKLLFGFGKGGRPGWGGGAPWMRRRAMEERLKTLSPEEQERFKAKMRDRMRNWEDCGPGFGRFGRRQEDFNPEQEKKDQE
jgi:hypothetical protein